MRFDIYGRFQVEIRRENDAWLAYRSDAGIRMPLRDLVFPADLKADELTTYLDDVFHEFGKPGRHVVLMPG